MTIIMKILTNMVNPQGDTILIIICMIIAVNKRRIYEFFFYVSMNVYMLMCFKSIWHDPRPYMVNTRIKPLEGYAEYGNPSGHVYMGYILISYGME